MLPIAAYADGKTQFSTVRPRHAVEFPPVVGDESQALGAGMGANENVVGAAGRTRQFKMGAERGVVRGCACAKLKDGDPSREAVRRSKICVAAFGPFSGEQKFR